MFQTPDIDVENSAKIIIHLLKTENEFVPVLELSFPDENDVDVEMLLEMRKALDHCSLKIDKIIDKL
jgi:hypothetical protein